MATQQFRDGDALDERGRVWVALTHLAALRGEVRTISQRVVDTAYELSKTTLGDFDSFASMKVFLAGRLFIRPDTASGYIRILKVIAGVHTWEAAQVVCITLLSPIT